MGENYKYYINDNFSLSQGLVPAGIRLIPHTVLTFMFLEQLKKYFGIRIIS